MPGGWTRTSPTCIPTSTSASARRAPRRPRWVRPRNSSTPIRCRTRRPCTKASRGQGSGQARVHPVAQGLRRHAAQCGGGVERRRRLALGRPARPDFRRRQHLDVGPGQLDLRHRRLRGGEALRNPGSRAPGRMARIEPALVPVRRLRADLPLARRSSRPARSGTSRRKARRSTTAWSITTSCVTRCCLTSTRWPATSTIATASSCAAWRWISPATPRSATSTTNTCSVRPSWSRRCRSSRPPAAQVYLPCRHFLARFSYRQALRGRTDDPGRCAAGTDAAVRARRFDRADRPGIAIRRRAT